MLLCVLILPFLSFLSTNLLGRYIGIQGSCILATSSIFGSFSISLLLFYECAIQGSPCTLLLSPWFTTDIFVSNWGFQFDTMTCLMLMVVNGVSALVHLYSTEYMSADPHLGRFMGYLSIFTFFMLILVTSDNFVTMFLGWEGIGLASFLLISFWYTRIQAGKSAIKAMLVNRVGDVGLALGICAVFFTFKSVDYSTVFATAPCAAGTSFAFLCFELDRLTVISFLLFFGAVGKSAQLGLHVWLPDAMEGPTPVSALIHAATLVTAGVFLIIRCNSLFEQSETTLFIVATMGALTAIFAASVGLVQNDLKRVIAFSTCSQLGYMVFACGISHYSVALFHLANHAVFKALLFLSAGCIIHGLMDEQDLRKMGGTIHFFPFSYTTILIGSMALVGFPFLTGFYSKDVILEVAFAKSTITSNFAHVLGCTAAFCTSFYSFRLIFLTFFNETNTYKGHMEHAHDAPIRMLIPLMVLGLGSIIWGFLSKDMIIGMGSPLFANAIFLQPQNLDFIDSEFIHPFFKNLPFILTLLGASLSLILIHCPGIDKEAIFDYKMSKSYRKFYTFLSQKWHFDQIYGEFVTHRAMNFGYQTSFKLLDKGCIEVFFPTGVSLNMWSLTGSMSNLHSGYLYHYSFVMMAALLFLISLFLMISYTFIWAKAELILLVLSYIFLTFLF